MPDKIAPGSPKVTNVRTTLLKKTIPERLWCRILEYKNSPGSYCGASGRKETVNCRSD